MANEELDGTDVVLDLLGESQRVADETRQALPQGVVEALNVVGFPGFFHDGLVALSRDDTLVHVILVCVKRGVVLIDLGNRGPQGFGTLAATSANVKRKNLARDGVHGQPHPLLVGFLLDKAPHVVGFSLEFVKPYLGCTGGEPHM